MSELFKGTEKYKQIAKYKGKFRIIGRIVKSKTDSTEIGYLILDENTQRIKPFSTKDTITLLSKFPFSNATLTKDNSDLECTEHSKNRLPIFDIRQNYLEDKDKLIILGEVSHDDTIVGYSVFNCRVGKAVFMEKPQFVSYASDSNREIVNAKLVDRPTSQNSKATQIVVSAIKGKFSVITLEDVSKYKSVTDSKEQWRKERHLRSILVTMKHKVERNNYWTEIASLCNISVGSVKDTKTNLGYILNELLNVKGVDAKYKDIKALYEKYSTIDVSKVTPQIASDFVDMYILALKVANMPYNIHNRFYERCAIVGLNPKLLDDATLSKVKAKVLQSKSKNEIPKFQNSQLWNWNTDFNSKGAMNEIIGNLSSRHLTDDNLLAFDSDAPDFTKYTRVIGDYLIPYNIIESMKWLHEEDIKGDSSTYRHYAREYYAMAETKFAILAMFRPDIAKIVRAYVGENINDKIYNFLPDFDYDTKVDYDFSQDAQLFYNSGFCVARNTENQLVCKLKINAHYESKWKSNDASHQYPCFAELSPYVNLIASQNCDSEYIQKSLYYACVIPVNHAHFYW